MISGVGTDDLDAAALCEKGANVLDAAGYNRG